MDFRLTPEQQMIRDMARDFADKEVIPHAREWEEKGEIPRSVTDQMAELGFMGAPTPVEYGGAGMDYISFMLLIEEIARGSSSLRTTMSVHISLAQSHLLKWASEEQKQKWVVPLARGVKHGAWALTEPNAGSDAANQQTTARKEGNHYVLNGAKRFISDGGVADYVVVFARLPGTQKYDGICSFLVEKGTPGFSVPKTETKTKLGLRASPTADLAFDDCKIPADHLIGKEGDGWNQAMYVLNQGRLGVAAGAVGIARAAFEAAVKYSKERKTFGRQIGAWQLIKEMIAESAVDIDAARFLVLRAAQQKDLGEDNTLAVSMAKLFGAQMAQRVTDRAVQIHGGYGFSGDFEVERYFRDARILGLYEGTNEIQKIVISDRILGPLERK
jgi:butyryl-CoA dehydrogenase